MGKDWLAAGVVALGLVALPGAAAPAQAGTSSDLINLDNGAPVHQLVPGETALWTVGVTTRADDVESLRLSLASEGPLAGYSGGLAREVTVAVDVCARPWDGGSCPVGGARVIALTKLAALRTQPAELANASRMVPEGVHILTRVTLAADAGAGAQDESVVLRLGVLASGAGAGGEDSEGGPKPGGSNGAPEPGGENGPADQGDEDAVAGAGVGPDESGPFDESLPHTGFSLAAYGLLGVLAVASGLVLSRWAALRYRDEY